MPDAGTARELLHQMSDGSAGRRAANFSHWEVANGERSGSCCFESFKGLTLANTISGPGALVVGTQEGVEAAPRSERDLEREPLSAKRLEGPPNFVTPTVEAERGDEIGLCRSESLARY